MTSCCRFFSLLWLSITSLCYDSLLRLSVMTLYYVSLLWLSMSPCYDSLCLPVMTLYVSVMTLYVSLLWLSMSPCYDSLCLRYDSLCLPVMTLYVSLLWLSTKKTAALLRVSSNEVVEQHIMSVYRNIERWPSICRDSNILVWWYCEFRHYNLVLFVFKKSFKHLPNDKVSLWFQCGCSVILHLDCTAIRKRYSVVTFIILWIQATILHRVSPWVLEFRKSNQVWQSRKDTHSIELLHVRYPFNSCDITTFNCV